MRNERGVTLITVVIMVVIISVISMVSIISSKSLLKESKEEVLKQNRFAVETVVSKYAAKAATSGALTPANEKFPGIQNPSFDYIEKDASGDILVNEKRSVGAEWYFLSKEVLEEIGIEYANENYLVNYKENIVIPIANNINIFELIGSSGEKLN